jgi:hypothetical protein
MSSVELTKWDEDGECEETITLKFLGKKDIKQLIRIAEKNGLEMIITFNKEE